MVENKTEISRVTQLESPNHKTWAGSKNGGERKKGRLEEMLNEKIKCLKYEKNYKIMKISLLVSLKKYCIDIAPDILRVATQIL